MEWPTAGEWFVGIALGVGAVALVVLILEHRSGGWYVETGTRRVPRKERS